MIIEYEIIKVNYQDGPGAPAQCYGACCVNLNAGGPKNSSNGKV